MQDLHFELRMRREPLGLERLLATLRRRQVNVLRFSATQDASYLRLNLHLEGKDERTVANYLERLTDVENVRALTLAATHAEPTFWSSYENPFG